MVSEAESKLQEFIKKFPLSTKIIKCEFISNASHGCWIDEHWKGPVSIHQSRFSLNNESGLTLKAEKFPKIVEFERPIEVKLDRTFDGGPRMLNKANSILPMSQ